MRLNYQKICYACLKDLPNRTKDILVQRFGLEGKDSQTLEAIGKKYGITRERVRQIEEDGFKRIKSRIQNKVQKAFQCFHDQLKKEGSLKREDLLLDALGGSKSPTVRTQKREIYFLLTLGEEFERLAESKDFYSLWTVDKNSVNLAKKEIASFIGKLEKFNRPLALPKAVLPSFIEISKHILKTPENLYGLKHWSEINPRNIKNKAYIVFKKENRPLHFTVMTQLVNSKYKNIGAPLKAIPQTVHNELIKDPRFVLIGRGVYALSEWGYQPGTVRELILQLLKKRKRALSKEEIIKGILGQRKIKKNTIILNLQNKRYFVRDSRDRFFIKKA